MKPAHPAGRRVGETAQEAIERWARQARLARILARLIPLSIGIGLGWWLW